MAGLIIGTIFYLVVAVLWIYFYVDRWKRTRDPEEEKEDARKMFLAPVWPLALLWFALKEIAFFWKEADWMGKGKND